MSAVEAVTAELLVSSWRDHGHVYPRECGGCGQNVSAVGITKIVYTFEVCSCGDPVYDHLIERLWHRECFISTTAEVVDRDALRLPADAAIEYLRSTLGSNRVAATYLLSLPELLSLVKRKAARSRVDRDEFIDRVASCERVLRAAGRLA